MMRSLLSFFATNQSPTAILRPHLTMGSVTRWELAALISLLIAFTTIGLLLIARGAPLGHDESVYALRSQFYAEGAAPGNYWGSHRAEGLPLFLAGIWTLSGTEPYLRAVVLGFGGLTLILTWILGRYSFGPSVGLLAATLLAMVPAYLEWSVRIGVDVPGMALSLAAVVVFMLSMRRGSVSAFALGVVPLVFLATFVRYGAPLIIGPALAIIALANWRTIRNGMLNTSLVALGSLGSVATVLLVPNVTASSEPPLLAFGSRQVEKGVAWWESATDYVELLPWMVGAFGIVILIGLVGALVAGYRKRSILPALFLNLAIALIFVLLVVITVGHGERRYLLPSLPFVLTLSGAGLVYTFHAFRRSVAALSLTILLLVGGFLAQRAGVDSVESLERFSAIRLASRELHSSLSSDCLVLTSYLPQVSWYSGCEGQVLPHEDPDNILRFRDRLAESLGESSNWEPSGTDVAALLANEGKRQPQGRSLQELEQLSESVIFVTGEPDDPPIQHVRVLYLGQLRAIQEEL